MKTKVLSRLANGHPLTQALAIVSALLIAALIFEAGNWLFGGTPRRPRSRAVAAASPTPVETTAAPEATPEATETVEIPVTSTVATAKADLIVARTDADPKAKIVAKISPHNLIGQETPFLVVGTQPGWYQVLLPVRPNETKGWVSADQVSTSEVGDFLLATLSKYKIAHYVNGKLKDTFPMGTGVQDTPTPTGTYYVWAIQDAPGPPYDPVILALSAFSPTLGNWPYGGIVGIHGWADGGVVGHQISNGCLRMRQDDVKKLENNLPLGTPVQIID